MRIPANRRGLAAMLAALALASGCASITLTASNSVSPVLLGPVKSLGGKPVAPPPEYADMCRYFLAPIEKGTPFTPIEVGDRYRRKASSFIVDMTNRKQSVASMNTVYSADYSGYATLSGSTSSSRADNPLRTDAAVVDATEGNDRRRVDVEWINCDGTLIFLGFAGYDEVTCKARGLSLRSP